MHVIATAGHVDHGKSTLIRALTGIDPDRLEEEKRRGLTIDLGFAWLKLPSGREVGIVDVPGHQRFIKNMLAGVGAVNVCLFVVAANEGFKPQSREHLAIVDLLGVSCGIAVITKADLVDEEDLEIVQLEVEDELSRTTLRDIPVVTVSATTGRGLDELKQQLDSTLQEAPPAEDLGRPRLWIDRVFTIKGSGTVVTGTLTGGRLAQGDEVEILPDGERARIRTIQSHKKSVDSLGPGNRTALNLTGLEQEELRRGEVLTKPGAWKTSDRIIASVRFLPGLQHELSERGAFKLHIGSVELDASMRFLSGIPQPGEETFAAIRLDRPTAFDFKDRFILRDSGRRETLGGGVVLEAQPGSMKAHDPAVLEGARRRLSAASRAEYFSILLDERRFLPAQQVPARTGLTPSAARETPGAVWLRSFVVSKKVFDEIAARMLQEVGTYQREHPLQPGMPINLLRSKEGSGAPVADEILDDLARRGEVAIDTTTVRTPEFRPQTESPQRHKLMAELNRAGASPPMFAELAGAHGPDLVRALVRSGDLVQVSPDIVYAAGWMTDLKAKLTGFVKENGPFTVAQFRDLVGTTRKYAVPLLEYLDTTGFTRRSGDSRDLR